MAWVRLPVTGNPLARGWAALALLDNRMLVFGGDAGGNVFLNDLHVFEFKGKVVQCTQAKVVGDSPPPVCLHTATAIGPKLYVFGGYDGVECFNHLYILQAEVSYTATGAVSEKFVWKKVNATGDVPSKRAGHSAIAVGSKIFVFGGKDSNGAYLGDSYLLNVDNLQWMRVTSKPPSQVCKARAYHTACRFGALVHIFGGAEEGGIPSSDTWTWNTETYAWTKLVCTGEMPPGLYSHVAQELGRLMIIFGGYNGQGNLSGKTHILNVDKRTWKGAALKNLGSPQGAVSEDPAPRARHSVVMVNNKIFIFGGIKPDTEEGTRQPKISYCNELMTLYGFEKVDEAALAAAPKQSMLTVAPTVNEPEPTATVPASSSGGPVGGMGAMKRPGASTSGSNVTGRAALGSSGPLNPTATPSRPVPVPGGSNAPAASSPLATSSSSNPPSSPQRKDSIRRNPRRSIAMPADFKDNGSNVQLQPDDVFEIEAKLAEGPRSIVYRGVQAGTGALLAIKEVAGGSNDDVSKSEIDIAKKCKHPNIASYYGTVSQDNSLWIVMEYIHGGSVRDLLDASHQPFTEEMIAHICTGALRGLVYLHHLATLHRAVRASNLLLTEDGVVKLSDFGVSRPVQQDSDATTPARLAPALWLAPEVIQTGRWTEKADLWALGITVIEMADLLPPHCNAASVAAAMRLITTKTAPTVSFPNKWSIEFNSFVAKCVSRAPADRPSALDLTQTEPLLRKAKNTEALAARIAEFVALRKQREADELAAAEAIDATAAPVAAPAQSQLALPTPNTNFERSSRAAMSDTVVYLPEEIATSFSQQAIQDPAIATYLADQLSQFKVIMQQEMELRIETVRGELLQQLTSMAQQVTARDQKIKQLEADIARLKLH